MIQIEQSVVTTDQLIGRIFDIQKFSIHDGPGIRTVVFLKGCPLSCAWCANPNSRQLGVLQMGDALKPGLTAPDSRDYTIAEVMEICQQDRPFYDESGGGVTLSGGEPLVQHPFSIALLRELQAAGIHTAIETTGCVPKGVFKSALAHLNYVIIDVKLPDSASHRRWTGHENRRPLQSLDLALGSGLPVLVRIPVIPGVNDSIGDAAAFSGLLREHGVDKVQLLPFHQLGQRKYDLLGWSYAMAGVPALHDDDLTGYQAAFEGVDAFF